MSQLASFREILNQAKFPVAIAGAGLSAASGIPTFRGAGGLWRQHDVLSLATPGAFNVNPSKIWQFYHYRREVCLKARPNAAHITLALLSTSDWCRQVFPNAQRQFHLITQNVDGLSIRAAQNIKQLQPVDPIQMHGSLFQTRCTKCKAERSNFDSPIALSLRGTEDSNKDCGDIRLESLPRCIKDDCKGLLRPAVVWFGESIPLISRIESILDQCDLLLVLGTSSTVYPAADFAHQVQSRGGRIAVFNLENSDSRADWFFEGGVESTLPWALGVEEGEYLKYQL